MDKDLIKSGNNELAPDAGNNPLDDISLPQEKIDELLIETVGEEIAGAIPIVSNFVSGLNSYQQKLDNARLLVLLRSFKDKHENTEKFQSALKKLTATPSGINLFQKVVRIVNANAVDLDYIKLLADVLKNISDSQFEELFEEHNYVLSQIEKLTPQALLLLSNFTNWPGISFSSTTASGVTSGKGWDTSFATLYSNRIGKPDEKIRARLVHVINELKNDDIVGLESSHIPLTQVGEEIYKYLR